MKCIFEDNFHQSVLVNREVWWLGAAAPATLKEKLMKNKKEKLLS